ncbi:MAG: GGDEF domain-containing protein [Planctomycetota bacterium]
MADFFLTALFRAAGLAVVVLPLLPYAGIELLRPDALLLGALLVLALAAALVRSRVRRGVMTSRSPAMAAALLVLAAALIVCIQRTGGLESPLVLLLGILVAAGALTLSPLANFFTLSGVCLLHTVAVIATAEGLVPAGLETDAAPVRSTLLLIELGFLGLVGFVVNALAWHLRVQQEELACRDLRDPETGTLRRSFFHARLVGLLEDLHGCHKGVGLILLDLGDAELLRETGDLLLETVRGDDLAGRVGTHLFAAAIVTKSEEAGPRVARRLVERLGALGAEDVVAGVAYADAEAVAGDAIECARDLCAQAEERLQTERVGFAA